MASIHKRRTAAGERWDVRWRVNGGVRTKTFDRERLAKNYKRQVEGAELAGTVVDPRSGDQRFGPYAAWWLDTRLVRGRPLSLMTRQGYEGLLRRNLLPTFDVVPLRKISPEAVRTWFAELTERAGQDAAAKSYRLLRAVLNTAVQDDRIGRNPCRIKGAGTEAAAERPMLDTAVVLELADTIEPRYRALVLLAGFGGLRSGELLGLRRVDVDLLRAQVRVRSQAQQVAGYGRVVSEPKSEAGRRTVSLARIVVEALDEHLSEYTPADADAPVFTGPSGQPLNRKDLSLAWRPAVAAVGAPSGLRIHDLRHHAATAMARMPGVTTKELMATIGHASPRAALIYQHATEERGRAVAAFLDATVEAVERPDKAPTVELARDPRAMARRGRRSRKGA
jgi:integrase